MVEAFAFAALFYSSVLLLSECNERVSIPVCRHNMLAVQRFCEYKRPRIENPNFAVRVVVQNALASFLFYSAYALLRHPASALSFSACCLGQI